jgi:hypothetical protein
VTSSIAWPTNRGSHAAGRHRAVRAADRPPRPGAPRELVFLPDLAVELCAWPADTWSKVGVDPQAAIRAVIDGWQRGDLLGLRLGGLTAEEALALERPAMTYVRGQLGDRLHRQVTRAYRQWRHRTNERLPGDRFL